MENLDEKQEREGCMKPKNSKIIEEKVDIIKGKHPALILGFLGAGLVGNIVATELINQLKMEQIGYVITEDLPPIAIFYDGVLKHPFQIYYSAEKNIVVAQCEVPFNKSSTYRDLARLITDWALKNNITELCSIQGIADDSFPEENPVYVAAEKEIIDKLLKTSGVEVLPRGLVLGPEAAVLNECLNNKLDGYALLTPVNRQLPWPNGAAAIIEKLNLIYSLGVPVDHLVSDAKTIREKLQELNNKTNESHASEINLTSAKEGPGNLYL